MRKWAREELTSIPKISEEERKKLLTGNGDATPQDIASKMSMFEGIKSRKSRKLQRQPWIYTWKASVPRQSWDPILCFVDDVQEESKIIVSGPGNIS